MNDVKKNKLLGFICIFFICLACIFFITTSLTNEKIKHESLLKYYEGYHKGWDDAVMTYDIAKVYTADEIPDDVRFTFVNGESVRIIKRVDYDAYSEIWLEVPNSQNITMVYMYYGNNSSSEEEWNDYMFKKLININEL